MVSAYSLIITQPNSIIINTLNTFSMWWLDLYSSKGLSISIAYCLFFLLLTNQKACCVLIVETAALYNEDNSVTKTYYYVKDIIYSCFLFVQFTFLEARDIKKTIAQRMTTFCFRTTRNTCNITSPS